MFTWSHIHTKTPTTTYTQGQMMVRNVGNLYDINY